MIGFIGNIGPWELIFILLIALIVVGPGKLPEVAKSIGKATRDFKKATSGIQKDIDDVMKFDYEDEKKTASLKAKPVDTTQSAKFFPDEKAVNSEEKQTTAQPPTED